MTRVPKNKVTRFEWALTRLLAKKKGKQPRPVNVLMARANKISEACVLTLRVFQSRQGCVCVSCQAENLSDQYYTQLKGK